MCPKGIYDQEEWAFDFEVVPMFAILVIAGEYYISHNFDNFLCFFERRISLYDSQIHGRDLFVPIHLSYNYIEQ